MYNLFEAGNALNTPFECFVYDAGTNRFPIRPHWHYFAEMIFMLEGSAEMHTDERIHTANAGDMVFFHPQSVHSIYAAAPGPLRYIVLKFDINSIHITSSYAPK
nr:AraC family ligand binding domain-containing protein [Lachnospiraceae bacterium]